jgi:asparagine synthase (glutamine-hydrolysing)
MCGITGYFRPGGLDPGRVDATLAAMTDVIRHRGPDDSGTWVDARAGIALGFRRLAILDLTPNGHQPMASACGRYVLIFNGEIYNFRELHSQLVGLGHRFRGHSDTEVMLAAFSQWGVFEAVQRFNGMFAFALWDRHDRVLHFARDRAGEKPVYYGWMGDTLLFGSELKALRAHDQFTAALDHDALAVFLRLGYVPCPHTIYRGIWKLPPGTLLSLRSDHGHELPAPVPYWSARQAVEQGCADPFRGSPDEALEQFDTLLRDAVKIRMEADVPLGAFLSGGIDSSTVVALMQAQSDRPVRTFTIGFLEAGYNEAQHARAVARHLGTAHTELYVTPVEALAVIPRLPALYDEPFADPSMIPTFLVSELARQHVTVSLSGDGGDELFGGYGRYRLGRALWRSFGWIPHRLRRGAAALIRPRGAPGRLSNAVDDVARRFTGSRSLRERMRQAADVVSAPSSTALYHYLMSYWKQPVTVALGATEPPIAHTDPRRWAHVPEMAHQMMYLDLVTYLPDDILVKLDRASMGVSLEGRVPLLDHRVMEFAWRLPLGLKLRDGGGKWLLRRLVQQYLPPALAARPKMGFGVPISAWLRGPLRPWAEALLDEQRLRREGILDARPIRTKWMEHASGRTRWDYDLWAVLMFQAWLEANPGKPARATSQPSRAHRDSYAPIS